MSFRELRSFTEALRTLGYPRAISMDNFRSPNFPVVADLLYWLVLRYDPTAKIPDDIDTENQRVAFLSAVGQVVAKKARLVLKTKNLYCADGRAVKELLKLTNVLLQAVRSAGEGTYTAPGGASTMDEDPTSRLSTMGVDFLASIRPGDLAASRAMAGRITERGARLHELLGREVEGGVREARVNALNYLDRLSGSLLGAGGGAGGGGGDAEAAKFERSLQEAIAHERETAASLEREAGELMEDEQALTAKLKKKRGELERLQKRLASLHSVRPAFMDEYERLEAELAGEYETYVTRYRNLDFLQRELAEAEAREMEAAEGSAKEMRALQRRLQEEGAGLERGEEGEGGGSSGGGGGGGVARGVLVPGGPFSSGQRMSGAESSGASSASHLKPPPSLSSARVVGNMNAPDEDDSDDDETVGSVGGGEEEDDEEEDGTDNEFGLADF